MEIKDLILALLGLLGTALGIIGILCGKIIVPILKKMLASNKTGQCGADDFYDDFREFKNTQESWNQRIENRLDKLFELLGSK
jgi:hypothetical protein